MNVTVHFRKRHRKKHNVHIDCVKVRSPLLRLSFSPTLSLLARTFNARRPALRLASIVKMPVFAPAF